MPSFLRSYGVVCCCLLLALRLLPFFFHLFSSQTLQDFVIYYQAGQQIFQGDSPYTMPGNQFVYPPSALWLIAPLGWVSYPTAQALWLGGSLAALCISVWLLTPNESGKKNEQERALFLLVFLAAFPTRFTLGMGQINLFVLFAVVTAFWFHKRGQLGKSGVYLGLAASLKIFPLFFGLVFLFQRQWRGVWTSLGTFLVLHALPLPWFGWSLNTNYYQQTFWMTTGWGSGVYTNQSLAGFLNRAHVSSQLIAPITLIVVCSLVYLVWRRQHTQSLLVSWSSLACIWLIGQSVSWQHYFVFLLFPTAVLWQHRKKFWLNPYALVLTVCLLLSTFDAPWLTSLPFASSTLSSHFLWATLGSLFVLLQWPACAAAYPSPTSNTSHDPNSVP